MSTQPSIPLQGGKSITSQSGWG